MDSTTDNSGADSARGISVLCVTRNRCELLMRCLQSCMDQDCGNVELIIIDNASDDETRTALQEKFPQATVIRTHRNIGFFPALNLAIANSTGRFLMTVDDDAYFLQDNALSELRSALEGDDRLAVVTCNIEGPREAPLVEEDRYVHTFKTGFAMIRREVFDDLVGYYPDLFFRSAGESYLTTALWDRVRTVKKLAGVRMYHDMAQQGRSTWDWGYHGLRSQILLVIMRSPGLLLVPTLISKFCKGFWHFLRLRRLSQWAAAWAAFWFVIPAALRFRMPIRLSTQRLLWRLAREQITDLNEIRPGSTEK